MDLIPELLASLIVRRHEILGELEQIRIEINEANIRHDIRLKKQDKLLRLYKDITTLIECEQWCKEEEGKEGKEVKE